MQYFFITENIEEGKMTGDFMTKPLQGSKYFTFDRAIIGLMDKRAIVENESLICERDVKDSDIEDTNAIWCHQNQLGFVHIFLILVCCRIATRIRISYEACDEEMLKALIILSL